MLVIVGSPRLPSSTGALASACANALGSLGAEVHRLDLAPYRAQDVSRAGLPDAVRDADGIVLASPVHHCGYSGLLKYALDDLPMGAFTDKAVGLLAHGGGPCTGSVVCEQLRTVARSLGGWVVPTHVVSCPQDFTGEEPGRGGPRAGGPREHTADAALHGRLLLLAAELHRCATMLRLTAVARQEAAPA
ncbi:NADPH-dependent FMN reductase [Streptomyces yaizuensis]|nr:NAD(P)H-dependent oxidoreductase [Streptomyces sp. YSPA8]